MKSTLKNVTAAVVGYIVMFAAAFVLFSLMWTVLGADGAFAPGSWDVRMRWIIGSLGLGVIVAISGGFTCEKLSADRRGVVILVALVIVMAVLSAMPDAPLAPTGARPDGVSMFDAMSTAQQPGWLLVVNPIIGIVGVLFGAKLAGRGRVAGSEAAGGSAS